jgi:hypothetical protein
MLDEIYDDGYLEMKNIWDCEHYLQRKYSKEVINRYITDRPLFTNYNLFGRCIHHKDIYRQLLKDKGFI